MNSNGLTQLLQEGFRVTIGAAVSLVETLQDPQKRDQNLSQLKADLDQLTQGWAAKGEITEQEARNFVDALLTPDFSRDVKKGAWFRDNVRELTVYSFWYLAQT